MLSGFDRVSIRIGPLDFNVYHAGQGDPLLLLHGYPQTAQAWRRIAPRLSERFHVVIPDLPGYVASRIDNLDTFDFSKRSMGNLMLKLVTEMNDVERLHVVGHDRGARVAFRMGLDHPDRIGRLALLGTLPTIDIVEGTSHQSAFRAYHWYFLTQPYPLPETMIGNNVDYFIRHTIKQWSGNVEAIGEEALKHYVKAFMEPSVIRATCEDYRAGFSSDLQHETEDREHDRKLAMPVLLINPSKNPHVRERRKKIWSRWADDLTVADIDSGHFVSEEAPAETLEALLLFFQKAEALSV